MDSTISYATPASEGRISQVAERLRERNFEVVLVATGAEARTAVLARLPEGSQVHTGKSKTLEDAGIFDELMSSGRYDFVRNRTRRMDRRTQMDEIRRLTAAPDHMVGSVQAVTEAGQLVAVSATGSQLGCYAYGAGQLILVVGSQKIVPDLDAAMLRITEHVLPYEDARVQAELGVHTKRCKTLIMESEYAPGRTTVVLVREPIGV
jgi:hypothetical protein